jgi:hypothetical protein
MKSNQTGQRSREVTHLTFDFTYQFCDDVTQSRQIKKCEFTELSLYYIIIIIINVIKIILP